MPRQKQERPSLGGLPRTLGLDASALFAATPRADSGLARRRAWRRRIFTCGRCKRVRDLEPLSYLSVGVRAEVFGIEKALTLLHFWAFNSFYPKFSESAVGRT